VNPTLAGIGSTPPKYSSYYLAGYVPIEELNQLVQAGAVGDVCGLHFDLQGDEVCQTFCERLVTISKEDLFEIPERMGIAGGPGKVQPALGALRGGYINTLVTDDQTARQILTLDGPR
jgi:deoxyribonucleoside regulator